MMQPLRIQLLISELRPGGAERVVVNLATALLGQGHAVEIVCLEQPGALAADAAKAGVSVVSVGSSRSYDLAAVGRLTAAMRRFRPDVINVHDRSSLPYAVAANLLSGRRGMVFSGHGMLLAAQARRRERMAARFLSGVTAVAGPAAVEYRRALAWPHDVTVIENGVAAVTRDAAARARLRADLGVPPEAFVFLAMGNLKPEKGFEDLLAAAAAIRDRAGDASGAALPAGPSCRVWIAGGVSDERYADMLHAMHGERDLGAVVRFLGYRSDNAALYAAADALVLPSRKEALPLALLEAMSAGLPIVATAVGGIPDAMRHDREGLLVPAADPMQLAAAMERLLCDGALRDRLASAAEQRAAAEFSVESMARRYLAAYRRAMAPLPRGRRERRAVAQDRRPGVLMLGPLPPRTGGMATVIGNLAASDLARENRFFLLDTAKSTPEGRPLWQGIASQAAILARLASLVLRHRIDIVHIHTCEFFGFWRDSVHALAARCLGASLVWHIHGGRFDIWARGLPRVQRSLVRCALEAASAVIVLSPQWEQKLADIAPRARWRAVPNGIPMPSQPPPMPEGSTRFLFLGTWSPRKGIFDLVEATERAAAGGQFAARVAMAGFEKEPGQLDRVRARLETAEHRDRFEMLGLVQGPQKDLAIARSHCLVLPSYSEGLPMVVLEAMAHGRPILATAVGAVPEVVSDGRDGYLIEPGDVAALSDRMLRFADDRALIQRMGAAARRRVIEEYSVRTMAARVASIYAESVGPQRRGRDD